MAATATMLASMTVDDVRSKIDALDDQILDLLERRATLAQGVGLAKKAAGRGLLDPGRRADVHRIGSDDARDDPASRCDVPALGPGGQFFLIIRPDTP